MNKAWAESWIGSGFTREEFPAKKDMYADTFDFSDYGVDAHASNFDELMAFFGPFMDIGTHTFEILDYHGDDKNGSTRWVWRGESHTDLMGLPLSGKSTEIQGISHVAFNGDGKLILIKDYWNMATLLQQIGVLPTPETATA